MALRLRRGTDSERQLITPLEGELIYTTDTKILYIGDGVTQGGLQVTGAFPESIDDLDDVDISSISPTVGQVLTWNGEEFLPADTIGSGEQINADIIADDSTILIDSETQNFQGNAFVGNTFTGAFIGDGSQLTNLPISTDGSGIIEGSNYRINIASDDSTIMVDTANQNFTGDLTGSVFGNDSSMIIDAINHRLLTDTLTIDNNALSIDDGSTSIVLSSSSRTPVKLQSITDGSLGGFPYTEFISIKGTLDNPQFVEAGDIVGGWKITGYTDTNASNDQVSKITALAVGSFDADANLADEFPSAALDIIISAGGNSFNTFKFDSIGQFVSPGPITPGVYADATARDTAITSPSVGMTVFNSALQKFQGYVDDTGIAGGGASNATPGWINLN